MRTLTSLLIAFSLLCVSCAETKLTITSYVDGLPVGTFETRSYIYGKQAVDSELFATTVTSNLDVGAKIAAGLIKDLVTAYVTGNVLKAREVTSQMASAGATQAQIAKIDSAAKLEAARINAGTTSEGLKSGVFTPEGTPFTQPPAAQ